MEFNAVQYSCVRHNSQGWVILLLALLSQIDKHFIWSPFFYSYDIHRAHFIAVQCSAGQFRVVYCNALQCSSLQYSKWWFFLRQHYFHSLLSPGHNVILCQVFCKIFCTAMCEKTIEEMALRICQPFRGLFNLSLSFTFIFNILSFNPPEYFLVLKMG